MRAGAAAAHLPLRVAYAVVRRPLGARVRRRNRDERDLGRGGDRLAEVDRAAAAQRDHAVDRARLGCGLVDEVRRHLGPARMRLDRQGEVVPARPGDEQRRVEVELCE